MKDDVIFGIHAVKQILKTSPEKIIELWVQSGNVAARFSEELIEVNLLGIRVQHVEKSILDKLAEQGNHQGLVIRCKGITQKNEKDLEQLLEHGLSDAQPPLFLILDNITDPHNLGACLRSAAAANVAGVILPKDKSASINATVRKVAAGGVEVLDIFVVTNLARSLDKMKEHGVWLVGTTLSHDAISLYQCDLKGPLAIVMGSEGKGLRRLTEEKCDYSCYLPMEGAMQSLNVSVATGICLFEALRQRRV